SMIVLTGFNGEDNIDDCPGHQCANGGPVWTDGPVRHFYISQHCTEDVDECRLQPNPCQNGGTCSNLPGSYDCVCVNGWTGPDCSENIDDCATAACSPGSTCIDHVTSFICVCPHGKTGLLCHMDDACISNPCREGSQCDTNPISGKFNLTCNCVRGYTGPLCEQDVNECGSNPCQNDGTCLDRIGDYTCICMPGTFLDKANINSKY
uniref:EGF-like domain-containing protein n=1 Tax=Neogobius melanostomus TaxID=47308 RepID=A0A8C6SJ93_9GOBI